LTNESSLRETRVLVSAGSKHGATAEIGERIGKVLSERGFSVTFMNPESVLSVSGYDAVVLGSAVYAGQWIRAAKLVADLVAGAIPPPATWLFSSGPVGEPPQPDEEPVSVADMMAVTSAREHRLFSGKIDKSKLNFGERAILTAVRAHEGDFRDWNEIEAWATEIADQLTAGANVK
jgi:menaquinone-dependent protoporphyrinogen oxidase